MIKITAFKCDFCSKVSVNRLHNHEKFCKNNPSNKHACFDCKNLNVTREKFDYNFEESRYEKQFYCEKLGVYMHSYVAERRKLELVNRTERMPNKCDTYETLDLF